MAPDSILQVNFCTVLAAAPLPPVSRAQPPPLAGASLLAQSAQLVDRPAELKLYIVLQQLNPLQFHLLPTCLAHHSQECGYSTLIIISCKFSSRPSRVFSSVHLSIVQHPVIVHLPCTVSVYRGHTLHHSKYLYDCILYLEFVFFCVFVFAQWKTGCVR